MQLGLTPHGNYLFAYNGAQLNAHRVVNTPFRAQLKSQARVSTSPRLQSWVIDVLCPSCSILFGVFVGDEAWDGFTHSFAGGDTLADPFIEWVVIEGLCETFGSGLIVKA